MWVLAAAGFLVPFVAVLAPANGVEIIYPVLGSLLTQLSENDNP